MKTETNYHRVIPRDLFNEAKLLKCMGKLCLAIHDNVTPVPMSVEENGKPFEIGLNDEGSLRIINLKVYIGAERITFKTTYNSKSNYPLYAEKDLCDYPVFDDKGNFDPEFIELCKTICP